MSSPVTPTFQADDDLPAPLVLGAYLTAVVLAGVLNTIVLSTIRHQKQLQDNMRLLYQILAVLDLFLGVVWNVWSMIWFMYRKDEPNCININKVFMFPCRVAVFFIMACLCYISFNLYLLISRPLRYPLIVTPTKLRTAITITFLTILVPCAIYLPNPHSSTMIAKSCTNTYFDVMSSWPSIFHIFLVSVSLAITLTFSSYMYIQILRISNRKKRQVESLEPNPRNAYQLKTITSGTRENTQGSRPMPDSINESVRVPNTQPDIRQRGGQGFRKQYKGLLTILMLTASFCTMVTPCVMYFLMSLEIVWVVVLDLVAMASTWLQPIVYLLTNEEAGRICRSRFSFRCQEQTDTPLNL